MTSLTVGQRKPHDPNGSIAVVFGTRPEIIKLAFVIKGLGDAASLLHTGQHYDHTLSEAFLKVFDLPDPDRHLGVGGKTRAGQIAGAVAALDQIFAETRPKAVVVQGDTNSTLAGALAANANEVPIVHVEAGLRSHDRRMPEEHNRVLTDHLADVLCAPTPVAIANARNEGIPEERITLTGNTVVEAVQALIPNPAERAQVLARYELRPSEYVLATFHRPENVDDPERFGLILQELASLSLPVLLPLHPRSRDMARRNGLERGLEKVQVTEPLGYTEFLGMSAESAFLVSDSGGVQEEASVYKRPVIVVRRSTERPEVLGSFAQLVDAESIASTARDWIGDPIALHRELAQIDSPYGDGRASDRVLDLIEALCLAR